MLTAVSLSLLSLCFVGYIVRNETTLNKFRKKQRGLITRLEVLEKYTGVAQTETDYRGSGKSSGKGRK